jgi:pimeloyl-ACP methyl ester carboxylesterase
MKLTVQGKDSYCYTGGKNFDATLPAMIFIHGAQNDHSVWGLQSRYFAHHGYAVLAPDLPGHGRSAGPALDSVEAMREWVLALMDSCGLQQANLLGHSMGALVALDVAGHAPQRVQRLALLGVAYPMKVSAGLLDAALNDTERAITMVNVWSHSTLAPKPSAPGPGFWAQGMSHRLMQHVAGKTSEAVFHTDLNACNRYSGGEQAAAAVQCPTLFVLGSLDSMTPPKAAAGLRAQIAEEKLVTLACGHDLMAEAPDGVLEAIQGLMIR